MKTSAVDLRSVLHAAIRDAPKGRLISVFAGSAVSIASPSNLPAVEQFKKLLSHALAPYDGELGALADLKTFPKYQQIPFERLLQLIQDAMVDGRPTAVAEILKLTYGQGKPNVNHKILAQFLFQRKFHLLLTTNFDDLFCRAHKGMKRVVTDSQWAQLEKQLLAGKRIPPTVAHLHGSLTRPESLVALMNQVGKPLQGPRLGVMQYLLHKGLMVFVGYRGVDEDINPIFKGYPSKGRLWLIRPGSEPESIQHPYRRVNLVPDPAAGSIDEDLLRPFLKGLRHAERQKFSGVIFHGAGLYPQAIERLGRSLALRRYPSTTLTLARAVSAEQYFHLVDHLLRVTPPKSWPRRADWIDTRAFMRRHLGQFEQAAREFSELSAELEKRMHRTKKWGSEVSDLIVVAEHEIEALLLVAATKRRADRERILRHCDEVLEKCHLWHDKAETLAPSFELQYYHAEIALMRGKALEAMQAYQLYRDQGTYWHGSDAITLVALRQAVAAAASGDGRKARECWSEGYELGRSTALFVRIQYLIIFPFLYLSPVEGYWRMRILAAQVYGIYGRLKFLLLRVGNPGLHASILSALKVSGR